MEAILEEQNIENPGMRLQQNREREAERETQPMKYDLQRSWIGAEKMRSQWTRSHLRTWK